MNYSEAIAEIITQADESFVGVAEARARQHFRGAIAEILSSREYSNADVLKLLILADYTFAEEEDNKISLSEITTENVLVVKDVMLDPEYAGGKMVRRLGHNEVLRLSYSSELRPADKSIGWYQVGETLYFLPSDGLGGKQFYFFIAKSPPAWSDDPSRLEWGDSTDMLTEFSYSFLMRAIRAAAERLRSEVS